jgi:predicted MFS family arabinose efflux permease
MGLCESCRRVDSTGRVGRPINMLSRLSPEVRQYLVITGNYWAFTLTDGALRMLVVLYFHQLGYKPLQVAMLFLFYEIFGVVTNLIGGWLGARIGLNRTMNIGLALQVIALVMLTLPVAWLTVPWVMGAQALSGIAKDLNKMSAKSSVKLLVPNDQQGSLFRWVAALTGSKNALKGVGFFLGGALLTLFGFATAVAWMAGALVIVWLLSLWLLKRDLGKAKNKPKFRDIFSKSRAINLLSAARLFLFGARDVWFVVALPVFLAESLGWDFWWIGGFMASWVIGYGAVQSVAPWFTGRRSKKLPDGRTAFLWATALAGIPAVMAVLLLQGYDPQTVVIAGLALFGVLFAINSSMHSYLIVSYAAEDGVSLDVGFYYMANALGRLIGTILSGWVYQVAGLEACLWISAAFVGTAALISIALPRHHPSALNMDTSEA